MSRTAPSASQREAIAAQLLDLVPRLRRRLQDSLPADIRDDLAGVTPHQLEALCHLLSSGGMTMQELAQAQRIGLSSATALADRLLRQGLAQRTSDPRDRRVVRLLPTEHAATLAREFTAAKRRTALEALACLDDGEATTLVHLLEKIPGVEQPHATARRRTVESDRG